MTKLFQSLRFNFRFVLAQIGQFQLRIGRGSIAMKKKTGRYKCSQKIFDVAKMGPREGVSERETEG